MDRRNFLLAAPSVAAAGIAAAKAQAAEPQGVHISIDADSPFFGGVLAQRGVSRVLINGEVAAKCAEASEPDGFVIQNVTHLSGTAHLLREPGAVMIPASNGHPTRVKRFGVVRIEFKEVI